ncbi:MAG: GGDEF domain-containing protein [Parvibaculaceae bacterium]|nr:GGDEF domain-containing protein [Parvibaculaceae bacterium]
MLTLRMLSLVVPFGAMSAAIGIFTLLGFVTGIEMLYRPISGGPATHPMTATGLILTGGALIFIQPFRTPPQSLACFALALFLGLLGLLDIRFHTGLINFLSPFKSVIAQADREGTPIRMGWNTALFFVLLSLSLFARYLNRPLTSQIIAMSAAASPLIAIVGYGYGYASFYGQMSLLTVAGASLLALGAFFSTSRQGLARVLTNPWRSGRLARIQLAILTISPFLAGLGMELVLHIRVYQGMPALVIFLTLVNSLTIGLGAIAYDQSERRARLADRLIRRAAIEDSLTKMGNRRKLETEGRHIYERALAANRAVSILMIDIDHFKKINDRFGHERGDEVLRLIASQIGKFFRIGDVLVRFGGEEFVAVLPGCDVPRAHGLAEKLRNSIAEHNLAWGIGINEPVTVSIGIAAGRRDVPLMDALDEADQALYAAKNNGRNRVEIFTAA